MTERKGPERQPIYDLFPIGEETILKVIEETEGSIPEVFNMANAHMHEKNYLLYSFFTRLAGSKFPDSDKQNSLYLLGASIGYCVFWKEAEVRGGLLPYIHLDELFQYLENYFLDEGRGGLDAIRGLDEAGKTLINLIK